MAIFFGRYFPSKGGLMWRKGSNFAALTTPPSFLTKWGDGPSQKQPVQASSFGRSERSKLIMAKVTIDGQTIEVAD
ncbi:MAG TPA: hypothetical protein PK971_05260, partial [Saprospiraceae bacterium]|nr:hypothetical protein [Saprospiraceae bacterium]